ncbi:MAG: hypothetical protein WC974_08335 [Thermoplasmata archaeon]
MAKKDNVDYSEDPRYESYLELDKDLLVRKILRLEDTLEETIQNVENQLRIIKTTADVAQLRTVQKMLVDVKFEDKVLVKLTDVTLCGVIRAWDNNSIGITTMYKYPKESLTVEIPILTMRGRSTFGISFSHIGFSDILHVRNIRDFVSQDLEDVLVSIIYEHPNIMTEDIPKVVRAWHYGESADEDGNKMKLISDFDFLLKKLDVLRNSGAVIIAEDRDPKKSRCYSYTGTRYG